MIIFDFKLLSGLMLLRFTPVITYAFGVTIDVPTFTSSVLNSLKEPLSLLLCFDMLLCLAICATFEFREFSLRVLRLPSDFVA